MYSRSQFASLEVMCRERAMLARKEMDYWLAEAEQWRRIRESPSLSPETTPVQLDWCDDP
jgi:hypothetical protein